VRLRVVAKLDIANVEVPAGITRGQAVRDQHLLQRPVEPLGESSSRVMLWGTSTKLDPKGITKLLTDAGDKDRSMVTAENTRSSAVATDDAVSDDIYDLRGGRHALTCNNLHASREAVGHDEDVIVSVYPAIGIEIDGDHVPWALAVLNTLSRASVRLMPFGASAHMAASDKPLRAGDQTWPVELLAKALDGRPNALVPGGTMCELQQSCTEPRGNANERLAPPIILRHG
jgi:hypothetical protein